VDGWGGTISVVAAVEKEEEAMVDDPSFYRRLRLFISLSLSLSLALYNYSRVPPGHLLHQLIMLQFYV
jgi:hypothetical protein